jgi:putative peptidoglycan lipid II flippase
LTTLGKAAELTLSVGTTAGVLILSLSLLIPLRRLGIPLRVGLRFPPGVRATATRLAAAGIVTLAAQQLSLIVVLRLSYGGPSGTLVLYQLAWQIFLLPWAVLAVPLATSAFPHLVVRHQNGDERGWAALTAMTTRTVLVVSGLAVALLVAAAEPIAHVLVLHARGVRAPSVLAGAVTGFAPGLLGYAMVAHLGRALYATGEGRRAATATVVGWIGVLAGDLALAALLSPSQRLLALAWGNTAGLTLAGLLLIVLLRDRDPAALRGVAGTTAVVLLAMAAGGGCGWLVHLALPAHDLGTAVAACAVVGLSVVLVYGALVRALDRTTVAALLGNRRHA